MNWIRVDEVAGIVRVVAWPQRPMGIQAVYIDPEVPAARGKAKCVLAVLPYFKRLGGNASHCAAIFAMTSSGTR